MLRVGREAIVTVPELRPLVAPLADRCAAACRCPTALPYQWYDTPNIHLCTVADFDAFLRASAASHVANRVVLAGGRAVDVLPNLLGELAIYRFRRHERA